MSSVASVALALIAAYLLPSLPVAKALFEIAAIICFLIAAYRVWLKEKRAGEAKLAQLQAQLDAERAKNIGGKIEGKIQEFLINDKAHFDIQKMDAGNYFTVKAYIINRGLPATKIKSFSLRLTVKGKPYESDNFHTGGLYKADRAGHPKTAIRNLADVLNLAEGLKDNLAQEGYLRFYIPGLILPQRSQSYPKDMIFNLEDVEQVTLVVTDYSKDYEISAPGIKPQLADVIEG